MASMELEIKQLHNQIAFRSSGLPLYPDMEVRPEWVRNAPAQVTAPPKVEEIDDSSLTPWQRAAKKTGSRNPRVIAAEVTRENVTNFNRTILAMPKPVASRPGTQPTDEELKARDAAAEELKQALS